MLLAVGADIAVDSLPPGMVNALAVATTPVGGRMHEANAEAVISERLDRKAAERAVRNLARARVIAQALGLPAPGVEEVTSESDAIALLENLLNEGLPLDETWFPVTPEALVTGEKRVAVGLAARVVPLGTMFHPAVTARLGIKVYRAREPMTIEIRSEESAYLGVFAWGADNRVVRLYPNRGGLLGIGAGEVLVLPRPGEGLIVSEPLRDPGNHEDHEAFIVVATPEPADFAGLAPAVGTTFSETRIRAGPDGDFFAALARLDVGRMTVIVLPYQVYR